MAPTSMHRMRPSERCDECSTRLWYQQEGLRYCKNGHQLEGFAAHDAGEDEYGTTGKVTRAKKEKRQKAAVKLAGAEGRNLYLEALQLILRYQLWWLVKEKGFSPDLETVTKGLWGQCLAMSSAGDEEDGEDGEGMSSGQSETEDSDASTGTRSTWMAEGGRRRLPRLIDTLVLCYLGCVVLRLPVTTAEFHGWAMKGDIEFLAAIHKIPKNVQDRLPPQYHRSLQVRDHIKLGKLLYAAQELVLGLTIEREFRFQPLNYVPILVQHIKDLTLPLDIYLMVRCLADMLNVDFNYPSGSTKRIRAMDNPEVVLITLIVVSTKLVHSLDGVERPPVSEDDPRVRQINWTEWQKARESSPPIQKHGLEKGTEHKVTANKALAMDKGEVDDFMDWFEKMWIGEADEAKTAESVRKPFQGRDGRTESGTHGQPPKQLNEAPGNEDDKQWNNNAIVNERYQTINATMKLVQPQPDPYTRKRPERDFCPVWRTEDDLTAAAKAFYQQAATLAAIPLKTLITAAFQVERQLEVWSAEKERAKRKETANPKDKGKGVALPDVEMEDQT
ncbi:hypothetical protein BJ170DRAFT_261598 [Xylariales sp. AK1849]|nr:hypothetical protein BJ170DRAFT_261598 [Xylariales sp. AK1849]